MLLAMSWSFLGTSFAASYNYYHGVHTADMDNSIVITKLQGM